MKVVSEVSKVRFYYVETGVYLFVLSGHSVAPQAWITKCDVVVLNVLIGQSI